MRNKLLGAIAAVAAGAGATSAQTAPPAPMPIGPAGGPTMAAPPGGMGGGMPGMMPGGMPGTAPGGMMPGGAMPGGSGLAEFGGEPGYPAGLHGQPQWGGGAGDSLFGAPAGVNSRLASRAWVNVDYLLWFNKSQPNANNFPLLTTSAPAAGGVPGRVSTRTLAGDRGFGYDLFSGYRIDGGFFFDDAQRRGVYLAGFQTEQKANITAVASDATGQPLYARPFLNSATGGPDVLVVSFPTFAAGSATVYTASEMYGAEGGSWTNLYRACPEDRTLCNINFLAGFRYLELHEQFRLESQSTLLGANTAAFDGKLYGAPATIGVVDEYEVYNRFYGGQVGFNTELRRDNCFVNATAKVALGVMNERLDVRGFSTISNTGTGADATVPGGLYANSTNSGRFRQDEFCVIPEFTVNFGYQWATWLTTTVGYNYMYVSRVARPGEQITTTVNPATVPTSPNFGLGAFNPVGPPQVVQSDYWMQGIQFGLVLRY